MGTLASVALPSRASTKVDDALDPFGSVHQSDRIHARISPFAVRGTAPLWNVPLGRVRAGPAQWVERKVNATKSLSLPAIFIHGAADGVTPVSTSENTHEKFTGPFERILLRDVGHFPQRDDPEAVACELGVFLGE